MANPFDQFDQIAQGPPQGAPSGNPFDQFDQGAPAAQKPESSRVRLVAESAIKGLTNLVGLPGTISDVVKSTFEPVLGPVRDALIPLNDEQKAVLRRGHPLSTRGMQDDLTRHGIINTPEGAPQNTYDTYLAKAVEGAAGAPFGPAAMIAGAGGGVGAQAGKEMAAGTPYEQLAEIGGGIVGGSAAAMGMDLAVNAGRRLVTPLPSRLNAEQQRLAGVAAQEGIPLTAAQRTGSPAMRWVEGVFEKGSLPFTGGPQREVVEATQRGFNRAVLKRMGVDADTATPDVMAAAAQRIGQQFDDLSARTTVAFDQQFVQDVADATARYGRKLPSQTREVFQNYLDDIMQFGAAMPGGTYQQARSDLTRQARSLANSDPTLSQALRGLRDALDDAAGRSIAPADREAWNTVRRQYGAMKSVEKAVTGAAGQTGDVSPGLLRGALVQRDRSAYARGQGDLNEITRVGNEFVRGLPSSGTAERGGLAAMLLAGPGALTANPAVAAAGVAAPRITQLLMNSRAGQAYLGNQLMAAPVNGIGPAAGATLGALPEANRMAALLLADQQR